MDMREVYVVAGSFVGFQLFFSCVSPVLSSNFTHGYGKLPPHKLNDWNSRLRKQDSGPEQTTYQVNDKQEQTETQGLNTHRTNKGHL